MAAKKRSFQQLKKRILRSIRKHTTKLHRVLRKTKTKLRSVVKSVSERFHTLIERASFFRIKLFGRCTRLVKIAKVSINKNIPLRSKSPAGECVICYAPLEEADQIQEMCHGQLFHHACLQTAIAHGTRDCPLCRTRLCPRILHENFRKTLLLHTVKCDQKNCTDECNQLKQLFRHIRVCLFSDGCMPCEKMAVQLHQHHIECTDLFCRVPMCFFPWNR